MHMWLWWLLAGCERTSVDYWSATAEICDSAPLVDPFQESELPSEACGRAILEDLGSDPDEVLVAFEVGPDWSAWMQSSDHSLDGLRVMLKGMHWMIGADYGSELSEGDHVSPEFVTAVERARRQLGVEHAPLQQVYYNYIANRISGVTLSPSDDVLFAYKHGSQNLEVPSQMPAGADEAGNFDVNVSNSLSVAAGLLHEAHHADGWGYRHIACEAPARSVGMSCDEDLSGAYGYGISAITSYLEHVEDIDTYWIVRERDCVWESHLLLDAPDESLGCQ